jgi:hypothetical protein
MPGLPAEAEVRDFGAFTIDVPARWTADQDKDGVYLAANDGSSVISILSGTLDEGTTLADAAQTLARRFKGGDPRDLGEGRAYAFTYADPTTGHQAVAMITAVERQFMYITQIGANDEADFIISTMKGK